MDRFEAMSMLRLTVERGSISAASRDLRVPLTTLSRKISDLEALLGARLLIRTTRKLSLTDTGVAYVAAAKRILEQVDDAERAAVDAAIARVGLTRLPHYQASAALAVDALRIVMTPFEPEPQAVNLGHGDNGMLRLKMRSFLDYSASRPRERLSALHS